MASGEPLRVDVPRRPEALAELRAMVRAFAEAAGFSEAAAGEILVAVCEAGANAIAHAGTEAGGGRLRLSCCVDDDALVIELLDYCRAGDVGRVCGRDLDDVRPGGLGVHCMQGLMDGFALLPDDRGWATLRLTRTRRQGRDEAQP
jgi:sigma-B regulation protein RsbU (phosphoserine phosphatase)